MMKRIVAIISVILGVLVAAVLGISLYAARSLTHSPRVEALDFPENYDIAYENVTFSSLDDPSIVLSGWYVPPKDGVDGATIVYVHGFQAERSWLLSQARYLIDAGYGAILFDLRNHGQSGGTITRFGASEWHDVEGAVNYLSTRSEVNLDKLGIMGRSMGGAVIIRAASEMQVFKFVIAQSTYTDLPSLIDQVFPLSSGLPAFPFASLSSFFAEQETGVKMSELDSLARIKTLGDTPVMIIHGTEDEWVPFSHGQALYEAVQGPKVFYAVEGAPHYPLLPYDEVGLPNALVSFVNQYFKP